MSLTAIAPLLIVANLSAQGPAINVQDVSINVVEHRINGSLYTSPYDFSINVEGTNITSVDATTPNGCTYSLFPTGSNEWRYGAFYYTSLAAICSPQPCSATPPSIGCGNFLLTITGTNGSVETATVPFNPGTVSPHSGYANAISPSHGQTNVALCPTITWSCSGGTCASGSCGTNAWYVELYPTSGPGAGFEATLPLCPTSWTPGLLSSGTQYSFNISGGTILLSQQLSTSPGMDPFNYSVGFECENQVDFTTISSGPVAFCGPKTGLVCGAANICATGLPSATATSGFTIGAQPVRGCRAGLLLYSNQAVVAGVPFGGPGNGVLCLTAMGLRRAGPIESGGTSPQVCDGTFAIDMNAFNTNNWSTGGCNPPPGQNNPAGFLGNPGTTVNAQMWGRDSIATGQVLSDGISWVVGP